MRMAKIKSCAKNEDENLETTLLICTKAWQRWNWYLIKTFNETELPTPTRWVACGDNLVKIVSLKWTFMLYKKLVDRCECKVKKAVRVDAGSPNRRQFPFNLANGNYDSEERAPSLPNFSFLSNHFWCRSKSRPTSFQRKLMFEKISIGKASHARGFSFSWQLNRYSCE